ncbi:MAG: ThuA domain-containing protein [Bacteroidales bacterium]|jgi:type 1 glutamine amidotransferase|nr:ThuA domain-containing protein [Bacteroidales bacterium]
MRSKYIFIGIAVLLTVMISGCTGGDKIKTLIITGQGSDQLIWMTRSTAVMNILDNAGIFSTKLINTPPEGEDMSGFKPSFKKYDLVVIDYDGDPWPEKTVAALEEFVKAGGGVVRIQSVSSPGSPEPPSVTRTEKNDFEVRMQPVEHPVISGLPARWMHPGDVIIKGVPLSDESLVVLATAATPRRRGESSNPEPVILAKEEGKGRVFWTLLGTPDLEENKSLKCAGFIVTLQRGAEWAATGKVTQEVPFDFPTAADAVLRSDYAQLTPDEAYVLLSAYDVGKSTLPYLWLQSEIRKAAGNAETLMKLEKKMVGILESSEATLESKKLVMKELSWMGTDYCVPAITKLGSDERLKDDVDFALERLGVVK